MHWAADKMHLAAYKVHLAVEEVHRALDVMHLAEDGVHLDADKMYLADDKVHLAAGDFVINGIQQQIFCFRLDPVSSGSLMVMRQSVALLNEDDNSTPIASTDDMHPSLLLVQKVGHRKRSQM